MASEAVKKILSAESTADRLNTEAHKKADDIISSAHQQAGIAVQKKLAEVKSEAERIKKVNSGRLAEYTENAEKECEKKLDIIRMETEKNTDKAVNSVINSFF